MTQIHDDKKAARLRPPAYPFDAQQLFGDLRVRLSKDYRKLLSFERLAKFIGKAKSTTHHWFEVSKQPHVLAFMCLLERLPAPERHAYIDKFCRSLPTIDDPTFRMSPELIKNFRDLLRQKEGLTIVVGGTESARTLLFTAVGHSYGRSVLDQASVSGVALQPPTTIVPLESLNYVDPDAGEEKVKQFILKKWPRILTARGKLVVLDGVWSRFPELRPEILKCCHRNHVIISEKKLPDFGFVKNQQRCPLNVLALSVNKRFLGDIRVSLRRLSPGKTVN